MPEHIWTPIDAVDTGLTVQITYQNEEGEEFIYTIDDWECSAHTVCWPRCSGDWPGCKASCPAFAELEKEWAEEEKQYRRIPPYDPFNFMLNYEAFIDDNNCYVEAFDTLDGVHWEIAVNIEDWLLEYLDEETQSEEYE